MQSLSEQNQRREGRIKILKALKEHPHQVAKVLILIAEGHWKTAIPGLVELERIAAHDQQESSDPVNHPAHYTQYSMECIDMIEVLGLGWGAENTWCAGNAFKYIFRHRHKANPVEDLKKARWYLNRLIGNE